MMIRRLVLILLLAAVVVYAGFVCSSIPGFMEHKRSFLESMRDRYFLETPPEVAEHISVDPREWRYDPFFGCYEGNRAVVLVGVILGLIWIVGFDFPHMEHKDLKLLAVILLIGGGFCLVLGGITYGYYDSAIYGSDFPYPYRDYLFPLGYLGIAFLAVCVAVLYDLHNSEKQTEPH